MGEGFEAIGQTLGFTDRQVAHALEMIREVVQRQLPMRAAVIVTEAGLVESNLTIFANENVPESLDEEHEAVGHDHRSVGILQQQIPSWRTAAECMDPATSTAKFLDGVGTNRGLLGFDWQAMAIGEAAQTVQVSAFPDRYQQREQEAQKIVDALWPIAEEQLGRGTAEGRAE